MNYADSILNFRCKYICKHQKNTEIMNGSVSRSSSCIQFVLRKASFNLQNFPKLSELSVLASL